MPVLHLLPELNIVQSINSWILYCHHQCNTFSFDKSISYVEQEIDFQLGSILPVKSCKIASLSFASRAKHCTVYFLLNSALLSSIKNQFLDDSISYVEQEIDFQLGNIIPVKSCNFASLWHASRAKHITVITSWIFYSN